jgi:uncharacterized coiled-coil protein SlyX
VSDAKSPPPTAAAEAAAPVGIQARIAELEKTLAATLHEVRTLEGKLANRDPKLIAQLKKENDELTKRFDVLKNVLFAMISESYLARNADEFKLQYEVLKQAALEYFKTSNTDPELWKSIAS